LSTTAEPTKPGASFSFGDLPRRARQYLSGTRGLILLAVIVIGAGMAFNWGWLVAIGVAPVILALAPCAALGLCMNKMGGKSCSTKSGAEAAHKPSETATERS
jgi:hypothetical protein